jgi:hypothetical protein
MCYHHDVAPRAEHPVPEAMLTRIGDVVASFALLESGLQRATSALLGSGQRIGDVVTVELSFRGLRALMLSLFLELRGDGAGLDALRELMKRAAQVEEERNLIVHSTWGAGAGGEITRIKSTAKSQLRYRFQTVTANDLDELAERIKVLAGALHRFELEQILGVDLSHSD